MKIYKCFRYHLLSITGNATLPSTGRLPDHPADAERRRGRPLPDGGPPAGRRRGRYGVVAHPQLGLQVQLDPLRALRQPVLVVEHRGHGLKD